MSKRIVNEFEPSEMGDLHKSALDLLYKSALDLMDGINEASLECVVDALLSFVMVVLSADTLLNDGEK